jgi:hypothetical protein
MRRTATTQDPEFNLLNVKRIRSSGNYPITIISDTEIIKPAILSLTQLQFIQENNKLNGFLLDIDENNPNTLVIKKIINDTIVDTGILYDTEFNKPDNKLFISPIFTLPADESKAFSFLQQNTDYILLLNPTENTSLSLFTLTDNSFNDYKQIRISNLGDFTISIKYNNNIIIEMSTERISLVWCKSGDNYTWVYVP